MAVEDAADRATFFNADEFGVVAVINGSNVNGYFDNDYLTALDVGGTSPAFECATSDLAAVTPAVVRGTAITIDSVSYIVEEIKPDGTGMTVLVLSEV